MLQLPHCLVHHRPYLISADQYFTDIRNVADQCEWQHQHVNQTAQVAEVPQVDQHHAEVSQE